MRARRWLLLAASLCILSVVSFRALAKRSFAELVLNALANDSWTDQNAAPRSSTNNLRFIPLKERLRFEEHQPWRPLPEATAVGSHTLPRSRAPQLDDYLKSGSEYAMQTVVADFSPWSNRIFLAFKTGAETLPYRAPPHFLTTFTKFVNFALYSDQGGRLLGHPVVDALANLPQTVYRRHNDTLRHRVLNQMRSEHWGWEPAQLDMSGGWQLDRYKNLPALYDAWKRNTSCDWFILMDDDTYIFHNTLAAYLDRFDPTEMVYTGNPGTTVLWGDSLPFAHGGSLIVCSRPVLDALFAGNPEMLLEKWALKAIGHCCGDALLAEALDTELGLDMTLPACKEHPLVGIGGPFQANNLQRLVLVREHMCNSIISFHHLHPHDMEVLYQYERLWDKKRPIGYLDIYRDFMLPYIVDERPNWVLTSDHLVSYGEKHEQEKLRIKDKTLYPAASKESCRDACIAQEECAAWSYRVDECKLSEAGLSLGMAANIWNRQRGWTTGYLRDRIREWRRDCECDPLEQDAGSWNDNDATSEGWFLRRFGELEEHERYTSRARDSSIPGLEVGATELV